MKKLYVVIYTDFGDSCDGFARIFGKYKTKAAAMKAMQDDIKDYNRDNDYEVTINKGDRILLGDESNGCQWQILEIESEVNNETKTKKEKSNCT